MEQITQEKINENLKKVENGEALSIPLSVLDGEFKEQYFKCENCGKTIREDSLSGLCRKCYFKQPKIRAQQKAYRQRPKVKAYQKAYRRAYYLRKKF